jgi:hypothetical protein
MNPAVLISGVWKSQKFFSSVSTKDIPKVPVVVVVVRYLAEAGTSLVSQKTQVL